MRQVHLVERDAEAGRVVLATNDGLEQFELVIDQALRSAVSEAPKPRPATAAAGSAEGRITPREIQMRVRCGESPEDIAEAYGADVDWVLRFAGPVLAERARIADEARRAKARRSTTEGQIVVFGEAVDERFAAHGIDPGSVGWDAHRREDGQWVLSAHWVGGQAQRTAEWGFHLSGRTVTPLDDTAADLLSDRPIRPVAPPPAARDETAPNLTLAPPLAPGVVAFPVMPDAHTGPLPRAEDVFDQEKLDEPSSEQPSSAELSFAEPSFEEPQLPMHVPDAPTTRIAAVGKGRRETESDEEKAARASIPSWDDILLGVRRKRD